MDMSRRELLSILGMAAGSGALIQAMSSIGVAHASDYAGPVDLQGDPNGASVLILGAGVAGMTAAMELRNAGYKVKVLEYQQRSGGRCWTLRGGDKINELGSPTQRCEFEDGLYLNPGPWRIPYHHHAVLDYCKRLGVRLESFNMINYNTYLHVSNAFGGKPQRLRDVYSDLNGHISEMLAKAVGSKQIDGLVDKEDEQAMLDALHDWGMLDDNNLYRQSMRASHRRGFDKPRGGGIGAAPTASQPIKLKDILQSRIWKLMQTPFEYDYAPSIFEPAGGMDMIAQAFNREVKDLIEHGAKVTEIDQNDDGVTVHYENTGSGEKKTAQADYCICTIPLSILNQIPFKASDRLKNAMAEVPYGPSVKTGLQFKRRFWEEDDNIFGGVSYTDQPIAQISYPSTDYMSRQKGVLLGSYTFGPDAVRFTSMSPEERIRVAVEQGANIHPQYKKEFDNGISVAWHRVPWTMGCYGIWSDQTRDDYYEDLCRFDGRVVLAGEHCSYIPGWQEGSILSSLDAIKRLHERVTKA